MDSGFESVKSALHNKSERRPDTQSALSNRQFGTSFCTILSNASRRKVIDKADCTRMFQIGDRRVLVAYFRTEFVRRDLLCKALTTRLQCGSAAEGAGAAPGLGSSTLPSSPNTSSIGFCCVVTAPGLVTPTLCVPPVPPISAMYCFPSMANVMGGPIPFLNPVGSSRSCSPFSAEY